MTFFTDDFSDGAAQRGRRFRDMAAAAPGGHHRHGRSVRHGLAHGGRMPLFAGREDSDTDIGQMTGGPFGPRGPRGQRGQRGAFSAMDERDGRDGRAERGLCGGGERGERGMRGGERVRVLGRGELPLVVLALLAEAPGHGYDIIRRIEERCRGAYAPSAGVIYPTLTMLEEQEFTVTDPASEAGKRRYLITEAGRRYVADNDGLIRGAFSRMDMVGRMHARESLPPRVTQAMETLKRALLAPGTQWHEAEAERIARVLETAAHSIIERPVATEGAEQ